MTTIAASDLYRKLGAPAPVLLLDVRNDVDFARWTIEGAALPETLNLPYFEFIEHEDDSVARVKSWLKGRSGDLAVVCAKGDSSDYVAGLLRDRGIGAVNVGGGMIAWGAETVAVPLPSAAPLSAWQILRFGKGCLSYVLAAGREAVVVDPHRRTDDYLAFAKGKGLSIRGVFDTHLHADHISGGPALSAAAQAPYYATPSDFEGASFLIEPLEDGRRIALGAVELMPLVFRHAPGHTPGSTVLVANDALLLTGDTLFVAGVGRPDLGGKAAEWGRDLHRTLTVRLAPLRDDLLVLPAHSSGRAELKPDGAVWERLGAVRAASPVLKLDETAFLSHIEENMKPAPKDYPMIRRVNLGLERPPEEERVEMELGKNECALSRR